MPRGNTKSTKKTGDPKPKRGGDNKQRQRTNHYYASDYIEDMPRRNWSLHDISDIKALTQAQEDMFHAFFEENKHVLAYGSAGTGKTFIGLYMALCDILAPGTRRTNIIIVRSAVQTRDIGFTPGTLEEKQALYENPYRDITYELLGRYSSYDDLKKYGLIQFFLSSFLRGLTFNNSIVIIDEIQNFSFSEINTVVTRLGENSRLIAIGDTAQNDLTGKRNEHSGMERFLRIAQKMESIEMIRFTKDDIVRSSFVREWITICEETP